MCLFGRHKYTFVLVTSETVDQFDIREECTRCHDINRVWETVERG